MEKIIRLLGKKNVLIEHPERDLLHYQIFTEEQTLNGFLLNVRGAIHVSETSIIEENSCLPDNGFLRVAVIYFWKKAESSDDMAVENGEWIMRGPAWEDPTCIHSWQELVDWIDEVGFLPLFRNGINGFSAEERTCPQDWWSGDVNRDPWEWRQMIARSGLVAYGKFFGKKAGFISKTWFPDFANWRRDGYDFDSRWDDGLATARQKKIMDQFADTDALLSYELKERTGFGKGGEKNFEGTVTGLQMSSYLIIRDFRQKLNKKGQPYGWPRAEYTTPEALWGAECIAAAYATDPVQSRAKVFHQIQAHFSAATGERLRAVLGGR